MAARQELLDNLAQHEAQIHQVEAALTNDPENEELLKLKKDLEDVITITKDLLEISAPEEVEKHNREGWRVGDACMALSSADNKYYECIIEKFSEDQSKCTILFTEYGDTELVKTSDIKALGSVMRGEDEKKLDQLDEAERLKRKRPATGQSALKKLKQAEIREQKKKKQQKKLQKLQEADQVRDKEKKRWQDFLNKSNKKGSNLNSKPKKSIFAVPDSISGKVGVGTCNTGGKAMTEYVSPKGYASHTKI